MTVYLAELDAAPADVGDVRYTPLPAGASVEIMAEKMPYWARTEQGDSKLSANPSDRVNPKVS